MVVEARSRDGAFAYVGPTLKVGFRVYVYVTPTSILQSSFPPPAGCLIPHRVPH